MTALDSLLASIERRYHAITVFRTEEPTEIEGLFERHGVAFDVQPIPANGPEPFVLVETDGEFAGVIGVDELEVLVDPSTADLGHREETAAGYRAVFDLLDRTVFTALRRRPLLAVSQEIEDRAYRAGNGTLHASFQTLSTFESQLPVYCHLATETDLDIHVHGVDDWEPPELPGVTYHAVGADAPERDEIGRYWVVTFDGGEGGQSSGLVAEETADGYTGFWTDDARLVEEITAALAAH
ncbi:DICT sensory domain-containing protein [Halobaculum gomorrense]|uniref:Diguanylate Cyclase and Two-component system sensory domain-containing protein n=1 Tax=Halobaculum gomorrense TaxID=43928 RepID=A0A1M5TN74_9EURY|nr:DICT sensory domain-containing protein [Halobaculum gomorrense]SHH52106.1 Diguanylate Cyclase and Two-component system sensory domain-containing protein [Halobaculum gomorrense]